MIHRQKIAGMIRFGGISVVLALGLSACDTARQFGPTYFVDTDESQYEADDRDFPRLGTYGDIPEKKEPAPASNIVRFVKNFPEIVDQPSLIWDLDINLEENEEEEKFLSDGALRAPVNRLGAWTRMVRWKRMTAKTALPLPPR